MSMILKKCCKFMYRNFNVVEFKENFDRINRTYRIKLS